MTKSLFPWVAMLAMFFPASCAIYEVRKPVHNIVAAEQPQEIQLTIVEGKTTKQEIIDALGMPRNISTTSMDYDFDNKDIVCKLNLVQKDGTVFNVELGDRQEYKYDGLSIHLDYNNPAVVRSVYVH